MEDCVYFSYFNNSDLAKYNLPRFSVALYQYDKSIPKATELLLPNKLFFAYIRKELDLESLKEIYRETVLEKLDPVDIFEAYKNCILLCHEIKGCHREVIMDWLIDNGFEAKEIGLEV